MLPLFLLTASIAIAGISVETSTYDAECSIWADPG